ncbi:hotdog fold thioesterase [Microbacteriaceae bacterium K1510]|nr:hotdog fold thioesterase [Microbacteriaceae bacterium K1510]
MTGVTDSTAASIWKNAWTLDELTRLTRGTLVDHLGIHFVEIGNNRLVAELRVTPSTAQRMGFLHGGASLALAETVGSLASQMAVDRDAYAAVGLDINANHCRPVSAGEVVRAVATPLHLGRQTHVWEVRVETDDKKLVCIARLTTAIKAKSGTAGLKAA